MLAQALMRCFTICVGVCLTLNPSISSDVGSSLPPLQRTTFPWRSEADGSTSASSSPLVQSHGLDIMTEKVVGPFEHGKSKIWVFFQK